MRRTKPGSCGDVHSHQSAYLAMNPPFTLWARWLWLHLHLRGQFTAHEQHSVVHAIVLDGYACH